MNISNQPLLRVSQYQDTKISILLLKTLVIFSCLAGVYINGWGHSLSARFPITPHVLKDIVFFCIGYGLLTFLLFPFEYYEQYRLEKRFNLSTQTYRGWFMDHLKSACVGGVLLGLVVLIVYAFLRRGGQWWYLWTWGAYVLFNGCVSMLAPKVLIPLFFRYTKVEKKELTEALSRLAERAGIRVKEIYSINASTKTKKANAFICGLGMTKRLVLTDTLLEQFTDEEIQAAVAHELAHVARHDEKTLFLIHAGASFVFFIGIAKLSHLIYKADWPLLLDIGSLPFFAVVVFMAHLAIMPFANTFMRILETATDKRAVSLLAQPQGFISLIEKLSRQNLSEYHPALWKEIVFFSHPAAYRRVNNARQWKP